MSTMVERVARALHEKPGRGYEWETATMAEREHALEYARAAIEAMRKPTDAMADAAWAKVGEDGDADVAVIYANMIDAALNEQEQGQ